MLDTPSVEPRPPPPLLVFATAVLGIGTALLLWFWSAAFGVSVPAFVRAVGAAGQHPLVLLWVIHYALLLFTAALLVLLDTGRRRLPWPARAAWVAAVLGLGVIGVWAYLARREEPGPGTAVEPAQASP